ncbi:PRD domain-containing protein [Breznakia pachnodae]|uniref:Beta-glucoside operon transcriptional antiterminator n=1 Tax=Breznakia pachnodae TaxID=265178 RepID=A0ABU0E1V4_9FIRM|nr:PRD domain-containing protein [Breznakia pachnodae]MDQ0360696.1 beta-glucoside operon transcriptional antiterminator [Breznakia pachnodae]
MYVKQVLNNNVIIASKQKDEIIVIATGIGFRKKVGDEVLPEEIDKTFILNSHKLVEDFSRLLKTTPELNITIADEVVTYASNLLESEIHDFVYLAFLEHISFAIERFSNHIFLKSPLSYDVKHFYQKEYAIGEYAVERINEYYNLTMDEEEAVQIALHFVNNQSSNRDTGLAVKMTEIVADILKIIRVSLMMSIDETSLDGQRLITHLRYFAKRILQDDQEKRGEAIEIADNQTFYKIDSVIEKSIDTIEKYLYHSYQYTMTKDERLYLAIHISRSYKK